jgi:hypothetical protein
VGQNRQEVRQSLTDNVNKKVAVRALTSFELLGDALCLHRLLF